MPFRKQAYLQTKTIFIGAGHSDSDPGAVSNGVTEADIVLVFRDMVANALRRRSMVFAKDGEPGENLPLQIAVNMAAKHDIAVEFHCNAADDERATGVETLSRPQHHHWAQEICNVIAETLNIPNRGAKGEGSGQHSRLAFASKGDGVIVELFFLTNLDNLEAYLKKRQELADNIAEALARLASDKPYG